LFDDRPVEIAELTYVIKQDLSSLNAQISSLQSLSKSQKSQSTRNAAAEQEGEHNKNVRGSQISDVKRKDSNDD
jgi:syntaxin 5